VQCADLNLAEEKAEVVAVSLKRIDVAVLPCRWPGTVQGVLSGHPWFPSLGPGPNLRVFPHRGNLVAPADTRRSSGSPVTKSVGTQHPPTASSQLVAFVEDVDAVYADLVSKEVALVREPVNRAWGMRTAHYHDPARQRCLL